MLRSEGPPTLRKLSDCVARLLAERGIRKVFAISGGASLHLIHSIAETEGVDFVCPQHEQAGAMAADAYSRVSGHFGCALATSGPGATNLVTGIASAYYDSVPVLFLTGNVATFRSKGDTGVRQIGFQETDVVEMCRSITNYAVLVNDPYKTLYELEKALYLARSGRPGPVLVDIPDDLQRMQVDPARFEHFSPPAELASTSDLSHEVEAIVACLRTAKRPVLVLGWGIHLASIEDEVRRLVDVLEIPVVMTWAARDLLPADHPCNAGGFGTHGVRAANFTVQNADFVLSIGSRLDSKATGSPPSSFAREARIAMVDIDPCEIRKFEKLGLSVEIPVAADVRDLVPQLLQRLRSERQPSILPWRKRVEDWKARYPVCPPGIAAEERLNPYHMVDVLSDLLGEDEIIVSETGCALAWMMQAFRFKRGQRFFHAFNYTPMGFGLPAAIGAAFAAPGRRILCVAGDGSLQMNIQELATVIRHDLPIKILLINNHGHGMVQQTQDQWLGGKYHATTVEGGLAFPDFTAVASAYGFATERVERNAEIEGALRRMLSHPGPFFLDLEIDAAHRVVPQVQFGRPNEDAGPLLDRDEFLSNMIVRPLDVSLQRKP